MNNMYVNLITYYKKQNVEKQACKTGKNVNARGKSCAFCTSSDNITEYFKQNRNKLMFAVYKSSQAEQHERHKGISQKRASDRQCRVRYIGGV